MPVSRRAPQADRVFARIDQFEVECPNCGQLLYAQLSTAARPHPGSLSKRRASHLSPKSRALRNATWNPVCQRLKCPHCNAVYMAGVILWSPPKGARHIFDPPPDVVPSAREIAVGRQHGRGFWASKTYVRGEPVNVAVTTPCSCPPKGWSVSCAVHGDPLVLQGVKM